ncbi:MAG: hypothetical protein IMZ61_03800 [Planctomycetes bacterium]|nr:hypothetical protein [Planctomycetota bacterium]
MNKIDLRNATVKSRGIFFIVSSDIAGEVKRVGVITLAISIRNQKPKKFQVRRDYHVCI